MTRPHEIIEKQFETLGRRIDNLYDMLDEKTSAWIFFEKHRYTFQQLTNSPLYRQVNAQCGVMRSNLSSWQRNGQIDDDFVLMYQRNLANADHALAEWETAAIARGATFFERMERGLRGLLPRVLQVVRTVIGIGSSSSARKLPPPRNDF